MLSVKDIIDKQLRAIGINESSINFSNKIFSNFQFAVVGFEKSAFGDSSLDVSVLLTRSLNDFSICLDEKYKNLFKNDKNWLKLCKLLSNINSESCYSNIEYICLEFDEKSSEYEIPIPGLYMRVDSISNDLKSLNKLISIIKEKEYSADLKRNFEKMQANSCKEFLLVHMGIFLARKDKCIRIVFETSCKGRY